jgi:predicted nuclease of predicted toxin-antitoxin system
MKFILDENVDFRLISFLTRLGHDALSVLHWMPYGRPDEDVLAIAMREKRILLTNDKDFGELLIRWNLPHTGVILMRLKNERLENVQVRLLHVLTHYQNHLHHLLIITQTKIRVRTTTPQMVS